jgi:amino acid transporter
MSHVELVTPPLAAGAGPNRASDASLARTAGFLEVVAQSIAAAAPSVALASVPGAIFLVAGNGTLLSILIATIVVIPLAYTISLQARRTVSSGSLGTYTGNGLGSGGAFAAGWGLIIGYGGFATGALIGAWLYAANFLQKIGINSGSEIVGALLVLAAFIPARPSRLRARAHPRGGVVDAGSRTPTGARMTGRCRAAQTLGDPLLRKRAIN